MTESAAADLLLDAAYNGTSPPVPDKNVVTVFTRTGNVITSPINTTDANNDGIADDPFYYPERGEVAGR